MGSATRTLTGPSTRSFEGSLPSPVGILRVGFWTIGVLLVSAQAWIFRYQVSSDSISYLDVSDSVLPGSDWHRLINGVWSPLYPFLLGIFRRIFNISPSNEVVAGHMLNIVIFIFAFACFEFFLVGAVSELESPDGISGENQATVSLPKWAFLSIAYSLFLWAAVTQNSVGMLRPDMLASGFLYLDVGLLLRMRRAPARWTCYLALGALLGMGYLAKAPMLPIGVVILAMTLFVVENWRPAVKMAAAGLTLMLLIGSLYFVPLSRQLGHFTLGESAAYNYLTYVDQVSPHWYLQIPGDALGAFSHPAEKIFSDPPAYAFAVSAPITHPLRFDPAYWIAGVRPHFVLERQIKATMTCLRILRDPLHELRAVMGAVFVLAFLCSSKRQVLAALVKTWPVWLIGVPGCLMYIIVHLEPRYVAAFLTLFFLGMILGFPIPRETGPKIALLIVIATVTTLLYPAFRETQYGYAHQPQSNVDSQAAQALKSLGIRPGDRVARITSIVSDYGVERILRVQVVAEVDLQHTGEFWDSPFASQQSLLRTFASRGVKAVIATSPRLSAENQSEWGRLGSTQYWVWRPNIR